MTVKDEDDCSFELEDNYWTLRAKHDGCFEITRTHNKGERLEMTDHIHVCDFDDFIMRLKQMRDKAAEKWWEWE